MKGNFYTFVFASILGAACALVLTAAADFTGPYKAANAKSEEILNILTALQVPLKADTSSEHLVQIYEENIHEQKRPNVTIYIYSPLEAEGKTQAIAVRFSGPGLWGPVKGFLALESDMRTIRGITFYEHEETPGLGGEIASSRFRAQFVGKSIVNKQGKAGITIKSQGGKQDKNSVDGITGATMTCDKIQDMLNNIIAAIMEEQI